MPWVMQRLGFGLFLLMIGVALWVSLWLLVILFGVAMVAVAYTFVRDKLTRNGILNPTPGVAPDHPQITVVEGEFERVESGERAKKD